MGKCLNVFEIGFIDQTLDFTHKNQRRKMNNGRME